MKPFISLLVCLTATTMFAWQPPRCPKKLVKYLPKNEIYWCHASKGTITALAIKLETGKECSRHMTVINEAENKVYRFYKIREKGPERMWNYEIFNIKIISRTEIEYPVEDTGSTMEY